MHGRKSEEMKKRGKRVISWLLCLMLVLSVTACGAQGAQDNAADRAAAQTAGNGTGEVTEEAGSEQQGGPDETSAEQKKETAEASEPADSGEGIVLTDQAGREVRLDAPAQRIVSCYYITTYACIALGLTDRLAGIESKAGKRPVYQMAAPALLELPDVGTLKEFNVEAAAAVEPDLVIMPKKLQDSADALTELGIPVLVVYPENQELLEEMLTLIGKACGVEENAQKLLAYYRESEKELAGYTEGSDGVKVYMAGVSTYMNTAPEGMYQADMIRRAGGENAAEALDGDYWTEVSYEDILAMNPDVMIVPSSAEYSTADLLGDAALSEVAAVKNGAVYQMPKGMEEWDSPVPSGILGVRWLCSVLHGDAYSAEEMKQDVVDFYDTFYHFQPEKSLLEAE